MKNIFLFWLVLVTIVSAEEKINFNRQVRPILSDKCFFCHGPDAKEIKGDLQLHSFELATAKIGKKKDRQALVPGNLKESQIWQRIITEDEDDVMPPPESHKSLTDEEKEVLKKWIEQGGEYQQHWSYQPIPAISNEKIDDLHKKHLAKSGLKRQGEADKRTLIRRLSFDLRGLPPTKEEIDIFLQDKSDKAWENLVDRMLADQHYGERMAVFWLDLVRFADTVGYHGDQPQPVFPYRDYVIKAFNNNKKFDQFTREQLAGDQLPNPTEEQMVATCYNRLNMMTQEGGAQEKEYIAKYGADRVRTLGIVWMGSTTGCCECHDHKYDPISIKDFYSLKAFFADVKQVGRYDGNYAPFREMNDVDTYPEFAEVEKSINTAKAQVNELISQAPKQENFKAWHDSVKVNDLKISEAVSDKGTALEISSSNVLKFPQTTDSKFTANLKVNLVQPTQTIVFEINFPEKEEKKSGEFELKFIHFAQGKNNLKINRAKADLEERSFPLANVLKDDDKGWLIKNSAKNKKRFFIFNLEKAVQGDVSIQIKFACKNLSQNSMGIKVLAASSLADDHLLEILTEGKTSEGYLIANNQNFVQLNKQLSDLQNRAKQLNFGKTRYLVTEAVPPVVTRVLPRGNWMDDSGEEVQPQIPAAFGKLTVQGRATRLDLANWLVSQENPLTARVFVNRIWQIAFGKGLSEVSEDLGSQGETPVYQEIIDSLADGFRKDWDVKKLVKRIVMTEMYRMESAPLTGIAQKDPFNKLLTHQNSKRLSAEFVRDNILEISGLLNKKLYGRSAKPYQPEGHYDQLNFPKRKYDDDFNALQYRRGVYTHWQRTYLHPMYVAFDAPSREESCSRRSVSNTPLQALNLLNDPSFVEAAIALGDKALSMKNDPKAIIKIIFENATGREPKTQELQLFEQFYQKQLKLYSENPSAAEFTKVGMYKPANSGAELFAWFSVARVIFNLHESMTIY